MATRKQVAAAKRNIVKARKAMLRKYRFTAKRQAALNKARRKWMAMSGRARRKAMPGKRKGRFRRWPVGQRMLVDVGRKGGHYQFARKTRYGWKKIKAPKQLRRWEKGIGYVDLSTKKARLAMTAPMRGKWKKMSTAARKRAMPAWTAARKRKARRRLPGGRSR